MIGAFINGAIVWALRDFRVHSGWSGGNPKPQPPYNQKGLISVGGRAKPGFQATCRAFAASGPRFAQARPALGGCHNYWVPTEEQIREALRSVIDPELPRHRGARHGPLDRAARGGRVDVVVSLTTPGCPIRSHFQKGVDENVLALEGVEPVNVGFDVPESGEKQRSRSASAAAAGCLRERSRPSRTWSASAPERAASASRGDRPR